MLIAFHSNNLKVPEYNKDKISRFIYKLIKKFLTSLKVLYRWLKHFPNWNLEIRDVAISTGFFPNRYNMGSGSAPPVSAITSICRISQLFFSVPISSVVTTIFSTKILASITSDFSLQREN